MLTVASINWGFDGRKCSFSWQHVAEPLKQIFEIVKSAVDAGNSSNRKYCYFDSNARQNISIKA